MFLKNIPLALFILSGFIYSSQVNAHPGSKRYCFDMSSAYQKDEPVPYWYGQANSGGSGKGEQIRCMHSGVERHRGKKGKRKDPACHKHKVNRSKSEPNYWTDEFYKEKKCRKTG